MAHQCTSCGSQTRSGAKFCHTCGTPIATMSLPPTMPMGAPPAAAERQPTSSSFESPVAPRAAAATEAIPAPTAYIPQTPQTYHTPPHPMPQLKKSGGAFKVILISLLILIALGLGAIATGVYFVRRTADRIARNGLNIPFPDGRFSMRKEDINEGVLGMPLYPGAQAETPFIVREGGGSFGVFTFTTDDEVDEVVDFYKDKLGENVRVTYTTSENGKRTGTLNLTENSADKTVVATEANDKTKIIITSILGKPSRNRNEARQWERQMREQMERMQREIERNLPIPPPPPPPPPAPPVR